MPEIQEPIYNRANDFLDTGYTNIKPSGGAVAPQGQNPPPVIDPANILDSIFGNLGSSVANKYSFLKSSQYTTPIRTSLQQTIRYDDPVYGYDPFNPNLEYQYGDRQSGWEKWKNNLLKFGAGTLGALAEGIMTVPGLISAGIQGDISKTYDNDLTNSVTEWLDNLENDLPNYETSFERDHPVLSYIPGFASFGTLGDSWGGVLKNLGFTAGSIAAAVAQDAVIGGATGGIGDLPLISPQIMKAFGRFGKVFSTGKTAEEIGALYNAGRTTAMTESALRTKNLLSVIDKASTARNLVNKLRYGLALTTSAVAESTVEANQTANNIRETLRQKFYEQYSRDPNKDEEAELEQYAIGGGNADLYANIPLLIFTEANIFGSVFKPTDVARKEVASEILGERIGLLEGSKDLFGRVKAASKPFDLIRNTVGSRLNRTMAFEGFQEGSQFVIQRSAEDYYSRKFDEPAIDETNNFYLSMGTGLRDVFNTREGLENIFMGALAGGIIHAGTNISERFRGIDNNKQRLIDASLGWLNSERLSGLFEHTYNEAVTSESLRQGMKDAIAKDNIFEYQNLRFLQLFNFVDSGVKSNRYELRQDQLKMLKELDQKEFEKMFGLQYTDQNRVLAANYVDSVIRKADQIKENIDKINQLFISPFKENSKDPQERINSKAFSFYKSQLALDLSQIEDNKQRISSLSQDIAKSAPSLNIDKVIRLTSEQGINETIRDFEDRIKEIDDSLKIAVPSSEHTKDYKKEKNFLERKVKELKDNIENYDNDSYMRTAEDVINYHLNNGLDINTRISPVDVPIILGQAQDIFRLINTGDRALYHYQHLLTKNGFESFIEDILSQDKAQADKFESSGIGQRLLGAPAVPTTPQSPSKDEVALDKKGNIKTTPVQTTAEAAAKPENKSQIDAIEDNRAKELETVKAMPQKTKAEKAAKAKAKKAVNDKYNKQRKEALGQETVAPNYEAELSLPGQAEEVVLPFERPEDQKKVETEQADDQRKGINKSSLFVNFDPLINYNRIYSPDTKEVDYAGNLKDALYNNSKEGLYNNLTIEVKESTQGKSYGEYFPFKGFDNIFYQGYRYDIQLISNGKVIGFIQPSDRLLYKKEDQYIPITNITQDEYEKVTNNAPETYSDFKDSVEKYAGIVSKIENDFTAGKTTYTNDEVKKLLDILPTYGKTIYSYGESTSTLIKDLKYKKAGDFVLSFPMIYNAQSENFERTNKPTVLNEKDLFPDDRLRAWTFVAENIDKLKGIDSRYIYVFQLPDGSYSNISPVAARPAEQSEEMLNKVFDKIKTVTPEMTYDDLSQVNSYIKDTLYIADSRNPKGRKTNLGLEFRDNRLYLKVFNDPKKFSKGYAIDTKDLRNFDDLVAAIDRTIQAKKETDVTFARLNLVVTKKDFKASVLSDEEVSMNDLSNKLQVSTSPFPFQDGRLFILPKKEEAVVTEPTPKKEEPVVPLVEEKPRWLRPITNPNNYWGQLRDIQQSFIRKDYDKALSEGKITEEELRQIVASTKNGENEGLPQSLVDDAVFRVGNQNLIDDVEYWKSTPSVESAGYTTYVKTIREVVRNGQFVDAINKDIITPEQAKYILSHTGQSSKLASDAIKTKEKEQEATKKQEEKIVEEIKKEPEEVVEGESLPFSFYITPIEAQEFEKDEQVLYKGKQYKVESVDKTASGNTLLTITDGTKYGSRAVYPEQLEKIAKQEVTEKNVLDDLKEGLTDVQGAKFKDTEDEFVDKQDEADLNYVGLKTLMERLTNKFGIPYKIVQSEEDWAGRIVNGTVLVNLYKFDKSTPFHEYLHPFIAVLKLDNEELYRNLVTEISDNPLGKDIIKEVKANKFYKDKSPEEIGDEALVRYISQAAAQNVNSEGRRLKNKYYEAVKRLLDRFRSWLSNIISGIRWDKESGSIKKDISRANVVQLELLPETMTLQDIADMVSLHDAKFDFQERKDLIKAMDAFQVEDDHSWVLENMEKRLRILADTAKRRLPSDELTAHVIQLYSLLKDTSTASSLMRYLHVGLQGLNYASNEFANITGKIKGQTIIERDAEGKKTGERPLTQADVLELSRSMGVVKNLIAFYKEDVDYLLKALSKKLDPEERADNDAIIARVDRTADHIRNRTVDILTEWLYPSIQEAHRFNTKYPQYKLTKEQFRNKLYNSGADEHTLGFIFGATASSKDPVSAITHTVIKNLYEENHFHEAAVAEDIKITYDKFLKGAGLSNDRKATAEFYKNNYLRKASVQQKVGEDFEGKPQYDYKQYWAFHQPFHYDLYDRARTDYMEKIKFDPENQDHIDKLIQWEKDNTQTIEDNTVPAEQYRNQKFQELYDKDEFFRRLYIYYNQANETLGEEERLKYGIVPQVSKGKNAFSDYHWNTPLGNIKTLGKKALNFILPLDEEQARINNKAKELEKEKQDKIKALDSEELSPQEYERKREQLIEFYDNQISRLGGSDDVAKNLDGSNYRNIHTPYVRTLDEEDLDLALPETVLKFYGSSNLTSSLREAEPNVALLKSMLEANSKFIPADKARQITKVTSKGNVLFDWAAKRVGTREGLQARINKQLVHFLDNTVYQYGEDKATANIFGLRQIDLNKLGGNWSFLTSILNMAGNVNAAISNVVIGEVNSFGEAMGGKFWNKTDWARATGVYAKSVPEFFADVNRFRKTLITQLGVKYDAIQGEFRDKYGKRIVGNIMQRYSTGDTLFFLTHITEHEIQLKAMIALMLHTPVTMKDGTVTNLYEAHYLNKEGYLRLKDGVQWSKEDERAFTGRLHGINKHLNGIYNNFDRVYAQRKWYGKAALIFRKHLYSSLKARWGKPYYDYEVRDVISPFYRSFFTKLLSDIKDYKLEGAKRFFTREGWNEDEKYAYNRTVFELGLFMSMIILGIAMARGEDDGAKKDDNWGANYLNLMMLRLRSDLGQYNAAGIIDFINIAKNPSVVVGTLDKFGGFLGQLVFDPFGEYKRKTGYWDKGDSMLYAKATKLIPLYNQWIKLMTPKEQAEFYKLRHKN